MSVERTGRGESGAGGCAGGGSGRAPDLSTLAERLRRRSRKVTGPRQAILAVLRRNQQPMSVREIFGALGAEGCDLATVYRSLHMLEQERMVQRLDFGEGGARFELLRDGDSGHHHHLICTRCSMVVAVEACVPRDLELQIAARNGFQKVTHRLEFFGLCPRCQ